MMSSKMRARHLGAYEEDEYGYDEGSGEQYLKRRTKFDKNGKRVRVFHYQPPSKANEPPSREPVSADALSKSFVKMSLEVDENQSVEPYNEKSTPIKFTIRNDESKPLGLLSSSLVSRLLSRPT